MDMFPAISDPTLPFQTACLASCFYHRGASSDVSALLFSDIYGNHANAFRCLLRTSATSFLWEAIMLPGDVTDRIYPAAAS